MAQPSTQKVAIIGFGVEGQSAYRYFKLQGAEITVCDENPDTAVPDGARSVLGAAYLSNLNDYDVVVRSPGVKPWEIITTAAVTSITALFFDKCPARIIGVSGTKGKSTTAALCARILGEAGWRTWVSGNGGQTPLDLLPQVRASHLVILELSSFQLMDMPVSPHIAICLKIAPEKLVWHRNIREYVASNGNIFWHQRSDDMAVYDAQNEYSSQIAQLSPGRHMPYLEAPGARVRDGMVRINHADICKTSEVGLLGSHNMENVCAAVTATWDLVKHNVMPVRRALEKFHGLEHRLEFVGDVAGVRYFDDSFSTSSETVGAAIGAFTEPKVLVLGGSDEGSDYQMLAKAVSTSDVRNVILIGGAAAGIREALEKVGYLNVIMGPRSMDEIVATCRGLARKGDVVVLSPGCKYDKLFTSYRDCGDQFAAAVKALKG
jgi:UDP-N-acetylmuramoylalanine--D-glutamate ligase